VKIEDDIERTNRVDTATIFFLFTCLGHSSSCRG